MLHVAVCALWYGMCVCVKLCCCTLCNLITINLICQTWNQTLCELILKSRRKRTSHSPCSHISHLQRIVMSLTSFASSKTVRGNCYTTNLIILWFKCALRGHLQGVLMPMFSQLLLLFQDMKTRRLYVVQQLHELNDSCEPILTLMTDDELMKKMETMRDSRTLMNFLQDELKVRSVY
jgi:hypothetical protein